MQQNNIVTRQRENMVRREGGFFKKAAIKERILFIYSSREIQRLKGIGCLSR